LIDVGFPSGTGLSGCVALVIGATEGLGRAVARLFAAQGASIAVSFRTDYKSAKSLVDEIRSDGGRALAVPGDARTPEGAWATARYVEQEWVQIDVLLHAAGLVGLDEVAANPMPFVSELAPGMQERGWGRMVIFQVVDAIAESAQYRQWGGKGLMINTVAVPRHAPTSCINEAARAGLFLGSAWNAGITGAQLNVCSNDG
jgi:3-oxoacyl-[acyl-carrier protein] reductase